MDDKKIEEKDKDRGKSKVDDKKIEEKEKVNIFVYIA